jgi:hypothetical protein
MCRFSMVESNQRAHEFGQFTCGDRNSWQMGASTAFDKLRQAEAVQLVTLGPGFWF